MKHGPQVFGPQTTQAKGASAKLNASHHSLLLLTRRPLVSLVLRLVVNSKSVLKGGRDN